MATSYAPNIVSDGIVGCWDAAGKRSYPGTGTTWTDLAGSNNGTLTNGPTFSSDNGGSIVFDGTDDYVDCGDNSELNFTNNFTLTAWFRPDSSQSAPDAAILAKVTNSNSYLGYMLWYDSDTVKLYIRGGVRATASAALAAEVWYYVVGTYDGATAKLYLNGLLDASGSYGSDADASGTPFYVGRYGHDNREIGGDVGIVNVYNRALTAAEILQNYNATKWRFQ